MLARLDKELTPLRASVDRQGNLLRLSGPDDATDPRARIIGIVEEMGFFALALDEHPEVARWYGVDDAGELSQEEARILAGRWVGELARERVIDAPERLAEPLKEALLQAFRLAARTGAVEAIRIERGSLEEVLSKTEVDGVLAWIERKLLPPP